MKKSLKISANKTFKALVWDWNGTLLNDVEICVESINHLLQARDIPLLNYESYRQVFGFPVRDYYEKAGFDFSTEPFDIVAIEFIDIYRAHLPACSLFADVVQTLEFFNSIGIPQYVLSAMQQEMLEKSLEEKGILQFFQLAAGTGDHFASGKIESAIRLQNQINCDPSDVLLIGDTIHDSEVAAEMGWECILIAKGHQSAERLQKTGRKVLENLTALNQHLNGHSF